MLHVYHYLTNIINQTVLPLHKKAGGNHFLRLLPIIVIGIYLIIPNLDSPTKSIICWISLLIGT